MLYMYPLLTLFIIPIDTRMYLSLASSGTECKVFNRTQSMFNNIPQNSHMASGTCMLIF